MKVLQVISHYVPANQFGGPQQVAHSLGRALVGLGHTVSVCTTNMKTPRENLAVPQGTPVSVDGVTVFYEPVGRLRYWGYSSSLHRRVRTEMASADVALLHFHYQYASVAAGGIARGLRKPFVVFTHGSLKLRAMQRRGSWRKKLYLNLLERRNFTSAAFVAYHAQEELEDSLCLGRPVVVPNGVEPRDFLDAPLPGEFRAKYPQLKGKLIFLFMGRIADGKGLDILVPAFARLQHSLDAHLVIAGGDERGFERGVRQAVAAHSLQARVIFTGRLAGREKLAVLRDADVFVLPSLSEGLSIAMLEAMFMGLPIVTTDRVGLWRQIQSERCGLVTPPNINALGTALAALAGDPDRAEMGRRGNCLVAQTYTWPRIAADLVQKLNPLCAETGRSVCSSSSRLERQLRE